MGFQETQAREVLEESNNSVEVAVGKLTALNSWNDFVGNVWQPTKLMMQNEVFCAFIVLHKFDLK